MNKNFIMAYSCGKDSTLALYKLIERGYTPKCLLVTTKDLKASWFHHVSEELVKKVGESLEIDVIFKQCRIESYEEDFVEGLEIGKKKYNCDICAFGDIDIESHKEWDLEMAKRAGLQGELPLWKRDRKEITFEFIEKGFKGIIKKVDLNMLDMSFLGKNLSKEVALEIEKTGADLCGENGEYHTFVWDGPIFKKPIKLEILGKGKNNNYGHLEIGLLKDEK